jgi:hypothetical protein
MRAFAVPRAAFAAASRGDTASRVYSVRAHRVRRMLALVEGYAP